MLLSMCEIPFDLARVVFATLGDAGDKVSTRLGPLKLTAWKREIDVPEIQVCPRKKNSIRTIIHISMIVCIFESVCLCAR